MFSTIDRWVRGCVVVPLVLLGMALTEIAGALITLGAWLAGVETEDE